MTTTPSTWIKPSDGLPTPGQPVVAKIKTTAGLLLESVMYSPRLGLPGVVVFGHICANGRSVQVKEVDILEWQPIEGL